MYKFIDDKNIFMAHLQRNPLCRKWFGKIKIEVFFKKFPRVAIAPAINIDWHIMLHFVKKISRRTMEPHFEKRLYMKRMCACSLLLFLLLSGLHAAMASQATNGTSAQDNAASAKGNSVEPFYSKALALWDGDLCTDPALAVALLNYALQADANHVPSLIRRGLAYSELAQHEKAFTDISQAIRLNPTATNYAYRALAFIREDNFIGARKDLEKALLLDPKLAKALNFRGALNLLENRIDAACSDFTKACAQGDCGALESAEKQGLCLSSSPKKQ